MIVSSPQNNNDRIYDISHTIDYDISHTIDSVSIKISNLLVACCRNLLSLVVKSQNGPVWHL